MVRAMKAEARAQRARRYFHIVPSCWSSSLPTPGVTHSGVRLIELVTRLATESVFGSGGRVEVAGVSGIDKDLALEPPG